MHVIFRESHGLEETDLPQDLGQSPADLVALSFSDSDLGAFAAGWHRARGAGTPLPSLRLANLSALRHPLSVDVYCEQTLAGARGILVRLIGGESYWSYGLASLQDMARRKGIALAVLAADGRPDERLDTLSTLPVSTLRRLQHLCDAGGAVAAQAALAQLALAAGLYASPVTGLKTVPECGFYRPGAGVVPAPLPVAPADRPRAIVTFYRSYLTAADTAPVDALITELESQGLDAVGIFAPSLKITAVADWLREQIAQIAPAVILNATAFSAQGADGAPSPLDAAGCPVFQIALSTAERKQWAESERGLSPADLAMHVVLPEVDGRILAGVASFKAATERDPELEFSRLIHQPEPGRVRAIADRAMGWHRLATLASSQVRPAIVLSTYPGRNDQIAHAVGLDALASTTEILTQLKAQGHETAPVNDLAVRLLNTCESWPAEEYHAALATLPKTLRDDLARAWGDPENDPALRDGCFHFRALRAGKALIALQPERGTIETREEEYHDLSRTPRHGYVAFYLWLRKQADALIHIGAHGTLEWLPGKSVALSDECWPEALIGDLPVIYPFIVNDPGEAAQAKRRIAAVTLGHLPPPLAQTKLPENLGQIEFLLDEYSTADGLDPARRDRLIADIRAEAQARGIEADLGVPPQASAAEAITRIDRFVCDIKESQFPEGLHVFGTGQCGEQERAGLAAALAGRFVPAGPSGSPFRGRADVLPSGRNLFTTDPRAVPSRSAHAQGVKLAEELLRKHLQDHGDWPGGLVVDLWGSATMRTAGEEFAMALHLAGLKPRWDTDSERVSGFEVIPPALLGRPRIDVTLRVSGLFRDVFPGLAQMFEAACTALADRDEPQEENPYHARMPRVFGPKPGQFGLNMAPALDVFTAEARLAAGEAWLAASSHAIDAQGHATPAREALEERLSRTDAFVHLQDLPETDLLMAADYAAHEAGFAAAMARMSRPAPALYHLDATRPEAPRARSLAEEIARTLRARAANPQWIDSMMRHGFRGGAEIAATLDHLAAFAHLAGVVEPHLFDLYFNETLAREDLVAFLEEHNPAALEAMRARFRQLAEAGLWHARHNATRAFLEGAA